MQESYANDLEQQLIASQKESRTMAQWICDGIGGAFPDEPYPVLVLARQILSREEE
jgi:hypothetical protein